MRRSVGRALWMGVALLVVSTPGVGAQSLFNALGIGTPMAGGMDARAIGLGGMGIGLMGGDLLPADPSAAADLLLPTMVVTARPSWVHYTSGSPSESGHFGGTFFPLMGLAYPVPRVGVASVTFGSVLDQRYEANVTGTTRLDTTTTTVNDIFRSDGGVSSVRVGLARNLGSLVSVGLEYGRYTGSTSRRFMRGFPNDSLFIPYQTGGSWTYTGSVVTGGASLRFGGVARLAGSVTWSSRLRATPSNDSVTDKGSYRVPVQYRLGASALLTRGIVLAAGAAYANWGASGTFRDGSKGTSTMDVGFGMALTNASLFGHKTPLRLGYHRTELPFSMPGEGTPVETDLSAGFGLSLRKSGDYTLAGLDLTLERGTRQNSALTEHFWRADVTLRVSGF